MESLLEKAGKDQLQVTSWRPLSLLNCDGKIYAKFLANRTYKVIDKLISEDQTGFLKGRYIGENLLDLLTTIDYCNFKHIPAAIVSLDLEKAFDKVNWEAIIKILEIFNFGPAYCHMVRMLYSGTSSCTINNGYTSEFFPLERALRQGCPYSPPAFLLIAEILALKIKQNEEIKGIKITDKKEKKISQYADDVWASLIATDKSLNAFFNETQAFAQNTGLKINYDKTQIMRIGSLRDSDAQFYAQRQLLWSDHVKVLGIDVFAEPGKLQINYENSYKKIQNVLELWSLRGLTPIGKILVLNTLAASQLIYKMFALPTPNKGFFFTKLRRTFREFIWESKTPRVAYCNLIKPVSKGGLNLTDLEARHQAVKITWVRKSILSNASWKDMIESMLPITLEDIWECNLHHRDVEKCLSQSEIWRSIFGEWAKLHFQKPTTVNEILTQNMWLNSCIVINNEPFVFRKLYAAGVRTISDIYLFDEGRFKSFQEIGYDYGTNIGPFTQYCALVKAIPVEWKNLIRSAGKNQIDNIEDGQNGIIETILKKEKIA